MLIPDRTAAVEILNNLVESEPLLRKLTSMRTAIVGGVVRDSLFTGESRPLSEVLKSWPDIDVAFGDQDDFNNFRDNTVSRFCLQVAKNHFGGLKAVASSGAVFDFWHWTGSNLQERYWTSRLEHVDFGINAVAFALKDQALVIHKRWLEDVEQSVVERLASDFALHRELQAIRAIVLTKKLTKRLQHPFSLGPRIRADVKWLSTEAPHQATDRACFYLRQKVLERRWPVNVWHDLPLLLDRPGASLALITSLRHMKEDFADDYIAIGRQIELHHGHPLESL